MSLCSEPAIYLPDEVVVHLVRYAAVEDIFSLKQTCRSIYASINADYLWHQILPRDDLPLALPLNSDLRSYPSSVIQMHVLRALRLRSNWALDEPVIKSWASLRLDDFGVGGTYEIKLTNNGSLLVVFKRSRQPNFKSTSLLTVYDISEMNNPRLLVHSSQPVTVKQFEVTMDDDGRSLLIVNALSKENIEILQVQRVRMPDSAYSTSTLDTPYRFELHQQGLFYNVAIRGLFIASVIMKHDSQPSVLLVNWKTGKQITISPPIPESVKELGVRILRDQLFIMAACSSELRVILIPIHFVEFGSFMETPVASWDKRPSVPEFRTIKFPCIDLYHICISDASDVVSLPIVSIIMFPSISRDQAYQSKTAMALRIDLDALRADESPTGLSSTMKLFDVRNKSYPEFANLGATGRCGVWLEQSLKSDYVQVVRMRCDWSEKDFISLKALIPPEPQLPFKPSSCRALAFDEASGRVCLGSFLGEVFILDYA